ncbi:MAG: twitching motility protein PilT [Chloroflexi bacterium RBG_19FT_COMBO_50_10]|nr:MAG: twitching motility protein PilT [Chloroflexi bacterium RBG_19FT_COMBO_50_10]
MIRIIGMIVFAITGAFLGDYLGNAIGESPVLTSILIGLVGMLFGLILTPYFTTRPIRLIRRTLLSVSTQTLTSGLTGLVVGLVIAALLTFPLSLLPVPFGKILPFVGVLVFAYFGIAIFVMRQTDLSSFVRLPPGRSGEETSTSTQPTYRTVLLDTSVIIDGRIADIARTGFLVGTLLIPRFVLNELQFIADSSDNLRRQRGRRGIEVISQLQKDTSTPLRISDMDVEGVREVDDKLVVLARQLKCPILTNDYNLNRIAELQGVSVLNVNELANAVKLVFLPGESIEVNVIQEGKESGQGVGYLDDGTMVVVEDGRNYLSKKVNVTVTKVLQTAAGRMIFARMEKAE